MFISDKEYSRKFRLKMNVLNELGVSLTSNNLTILDQAFDNYGTFDRAKALELAENIKRVEERSSDDGN